VENYCDAQNRARAERRQFFRTLTGQAGDLLYNIMDVCIVYVKITVVKSENNIRGFALPTFASGVLTGRVIRRKRILRFTHGNCCSSTVRTFQVLPKYQPIPPFEFWPITIMCVWSDMIYNIFIQYIQRFYTNICIM